MKYTIKQFQQEFPTDNVCLDYIFAQKYGKSPKCPKCSKKGFSKVSERKCYACNWCGYQIHPVAGTIFHKSRTPLTLWLYAIYLMSQSRNGVSAKELERQLGVTYKTAWRMAHEIRKLMKESHTPTDGTFECDETYVGGRSKGTVGRGTKKAPVFGVVKRGGHVDTRYVPNVKIKTIMPIVRENVKEGAVLNTDEYHIYKHSCGDWIHQTIRHGERKYVDGDAHTNTIEGHWSLIKRSIRGTYIHVSKKHLQSYLDEFSFRSNHRASETPIFHLMVGKVV